MALDQRERDPLLLRDVILPLHLDEESLASLEHEQIRVTAAPIAAPLIHPPLRAVRFHVEFATVASPKTSCIRLKAGCPVRLLPGYERSMKPTKSGSAYFSSAGSQNQTV